LVRDFDLKLLYKVGYYIFMGFMTVSKPEKSPTTEISVPINLVNRITNKNKILELRSNWVSVSKINDHVYKPDIGVCLVEL
jgi:hypothetical protein